jgi:glycosyltransferase involved in cell wall biosynthesis
MKVFVGNSELMARNILIHTRNLNIPGGKQTYLIALQAYFKNYISYFYYGAPKPVKESNFGFLRRFFGDYVKFYRVLKRGNFDVVHINTSFNPKSYFRDSIFTLISKMLRCKTIVYWHGWRWDFEKKYASKILPYFRFTFGKADAMICLANEFAERLKEYGYKRHVYVETTVVEDIIINPNRKNYSTESLGSNERNKSILFLSRVEKAKGIYETIDAFNNIQNMFPNIKLNIAGVGSELGRVKNYVAEKGIEGVRFLGWIDGNQKVRALNDSDIFVLASNQGEGMPICILEAMASGKSVVTTNVGAIRDFFEDGVMGLIVKMNDPIDLGQNIQRLLSDPELLKRIGSYNANYAKERFSARLVCERLENIYEATIECSN